MENGYTISKDQSSVMKDGKEVAVFAEDGNLGCGECFFRHINCEDAPCARRTRTDKKTGIFITKTE